VEASKNTVPNSAKNKDKTRDSEMHSTRNGSQWPFEMKAQTWRFSRDRLVIGPKETPAFIIQN
jgi:hypothetical protein